MCAACRYLSDLCIASAVQEEFTLKVMTLSASWAPTADQPHIVVLGEPVGHGAVVPDEGRDRDRDRHETAIGLARPRAEERTERALRARDNRLSFRVPSRFGCRHSHKSKTFEIRGDPSGVRHATSNMLDAAIIIHYH